MKAIKTPTGIITVDDPAVVLTQAEYDALPEDKKNKGIYYITDTGSSEVLDIIGITDFSSIGYTITDALVNLNTSNNKISQNQSSADAHIASLIAGTSEANGNAELIDARLNNDGYVYNTLGNSMRAVEDEIDKVTTGTKSINLFNKDDVIIGYVNGSSIVDSSEYVTSGYIPVNSANGTNVFIERIAKNAVEPHGLCESASMYSISRFDSSKTFIYGMNGSNPHGISIDLSAQQDKTRPVAYVRISLLLSDFLQYNYQLVQLNEYVARNYEDYGYTRKLKLSNNIYIENNKLVIDAR